MNIRFATVEDIPAILAISNWAAINTPANFAIEPESVDSWLKSFHETHAKYPWLVAEESPTNEVVGFAKASPHKGRCAYAYAAETSIYIHPDHHGKGLGTTLYGALIPLLKRQGFTTLLAGITTPNAASQRLHEAFGFKRVATFERVGWKFNRWHDVGYWQLMLSDHDQPPSRLLTVAEAAAITATC